MTHLRDIRTWRQEGHGMSLSTLMKIFSIPAGNSKERQGVWTSGPCNRLGHCGSKPYLPCRAIGTFFLALPSVCPLWSIDTHYKSFHSKFLCKCTCHLLKQPLIMHRFTSQEKQPVAQIPNAKQDEIHYLAQRLSTAYSSLVTLCFMLLTPCSHSPGYFAPQAHCRRLPMFSTLC